MKDPDRHELISRALRGELTESEQEDFDLLLRQDESFRTEWHWERSLEKAFEALPTPPLSSNFTSLVLQAALRPDPAQRSDPARTSFRFVFAKLAAACAVVVLLVVAVSQQHQRTQRRELAATVNAFNDVAMVVGNDPMASTELFENFEAIERLSLPAESELDMELLVALQK